MLDFTLMLGGLIIGVRDNDAIIPACVLAGVQSRLLHNVITDKAQGLFPIQNCDLIFLEQLPLLVLKTIFDAIDPFDLIRLLNGLGLRWSDSSAVKANPALHVRARIFQTSLRATKSAPSIYFTCQCVFFFI
jgi:hypothetical protein